MITCPECEIGLPDGTRRCPMCDRLLSVRWLVLRTAGAVLLAAVLGLGLWGSGKIKNKLAWRQTTPADVYRAARAFVEKNPAVRGAVNFSKLEESQVERWDLKRWRVAGYVETQPKPGVKIRTLYFCVLRDNGGGNWTIEDLHFERLE